jgi:two-component system sensor kinase FixL
MKLASPDQLQQVVEALGVSAIELDDHLIVRSISGVAIDRDAAASVEMIGSPVFEVWPALRDGELQQAVAEVLATGRARTVEGQFPWAGSSSNAADTWVQPWGSGILLISTEGSSKKAEAQRQADQERQQLQSELIHISRVSAMGTMASTLAHELNQPLTAIINCLAGCERMLDEKKIDRREMQNALERARDSADRAAETIRRIRLMVTKGEVIKEPVHISAIFREALALGLMGMRKGDLVVVRDIDEQLLVVVDVVQLQQVLLNLIRNAVEAMANSKVRELTIGARQAGDKIVIEISDTGAGIPPEDRPRLFDAFFSTKKSGLGIGLLISRTIIEAHGGHIRAEEALSGGAKFVIELPVSKHLN